MDIQYQEELLDFGPSNPWFGLLIPVSARGDANRPAKKRGTTPIYTYDHPLVAQARELKISGLIDLHISRHLKVDPKTVHRWKVKGFLKPM